MALKKKVLEFINTTERRVKLASIMGCTEQTIKNYIASNDPKLTQYVPLEHIRKIYGCLEAGELLEPQKQTA